MTKRDKSFLVFFIVLALGLSPAVAATKAPKPVNLKGFSEFVTKTMAEWKVPGMAVAIVKDSKVIFAEGFGFRDVEQGLKVTPRTIFPIGSSSKAFTAADVGILVDEGKVGWDEPVRTYLPDFKVQDEYASAHITLRDMLSHRTGLARHELMWMGGQFSRRELYDRLRYLEINKDLRTTMQYNNLMIMTAGYLVGKVDGSSWEEFTQRKILDPLGMKETNFSVALTQKTADFSYPYMEIKDKVERVPFRDIAAIGPAGSINSNVLDMAQWVMLQLGKGKFGEKQIISEAAIGQLHTPQMAMQGAILPFAQRSSEFGFESCGMGWLIDNYRGHLFIQHGGNVDGFTALVGFFPRENIGLVVLSNLNANLGPYSVALNAYERLLGLDQTAWNDRMKELLAKMKAEAKKTEAEKDKDRKPDTRPSHPLADYAGDYENPGYGTVSVITDGDGLKLKTPVLEGPLSHYHYDIFNLETMLLGNEMKFKVAFSTDLKGNIAGLSIPLALDPSVKDIVFTRAADKGMMEKGFLEKFVGTYILSGVEIKVALLEGKGLIMTLPGQQDFELVPYRGTEFNLKGMPGYSVEFKQDAAGVVTELISHQPNGTFTAKKK